MRPRDKREILIDVRGDLCIVRATLQDVSNFFSLFLDTPRPEWITRDDEKNIVFPMTNDHIFTLGDIAAKSGKFIIYEGEPCAA